MSVPDRERKEHAVSELIGAILLVGLVITAMAIVAVLLLSNPPPEEVPQLNILASRNETSKQFFLYHNGGDAMRIENTIIRINNDSSPISNKAINITNEDGTNQAWAGSNIPWSLGKTLIIPSVEIPKSISIVYQGPTSQNLILTTSFSPSSSGTGSSGSGSSIIADFSGNPLSGNSPLSVQFTDLSKGNPTQWQWDINNDGVIDYTDQNPLHTYTTAGTYSVNLIVSNSGGSNNLLKPGYITVTEESGINDFIDENVFVYGNKLDFQGDIINGPGATVIINGGLDTSNTNLGSSIAVTRIYIDGNVNLNSGSAGLGSSSNPGTICINGDLALGSGQRHIYGDVYVAGDFSLKDAIIHDKVYVNGDVTLEWTPTLDDDARIYYTGNLYHPSDYPEGILDKCIPQTSVPGCVIPDLTLPPVKSQSWYDTNGYVSSGALTSNLKIFADSYSSTSWESSAYNVVIIARNGDITLSGLGSSGVTGVLYAPKGRVTFNGAFFNGVVLTRDGFFVTSGGTDITFSNFENYFSSPDDYPL